MQSSCAESRGRSKLFASERAVVQQAIGSCLACLRPSEAFCFGWLNELRLLLCFGRNLSRLFGSSFEWRLLPLLPLLLGSWSFLFSILFPGLVRCIGLFLELDPQKNDASTGRIGASSHQHVLRSAGGFAGAREGSRRLDPARSRRSPGPDKLKTRRGGKVRVKL